MTQQSVGTVRLAGRDWIGFVTLSLAIVAGMLAHAVRLEHRLTSIEVKVDSLMRAQVAESSVPANARVFLSSTSEGEP